MHTNNVNVNSSNLGEHPAGMHVLIVCTGNICRSPAAELVLNALALPGVHVESAGTSALVGEKVDAQMRRVLENDGVPTADFRSRQLTVPTIQNSDLILAATGAHRSIILREVPGALRRTFTLRELADLIELAERDGPLESCGRSVRFSQLIRLRSIRSRDTENNIEDPYRLSDAHYLRAYRIISDAIRGPIARLLTSLVE